MNRLPLLTVAALALFTAACAKKETPAPPAAPQVRVVTINGNDQMKFDVTSFEVNSGETVRLVLVNTGVLPKAAMGHNLVLLKAGVDAQKYAMAAIAAAKTEYVPADLADQTIGATRLIGPKEKAELTFVAPAPGEYVYLCTFPGHYGAGMRGVMTVK